MNRDWIDEIPTDDVIRVGGYVKLSERYYEWHIREFPLMGQPEVVTSEWEVLLVQNDRLIIARAKNDYLHWMWVDTDLVDKVKS